MKNPQTLHEAVLDRLAQVIDPETGVDVVHMRLIEDLTVDETGRVSCSSAHHRHSARWPCRFRRASGRPSLR